MFHTFNFLQLIPPLEGVLENHNPQASFVVCDIDSTLLFSSGDVIRENPRGMYVHSLAQMLQYPIVYVTARPEVAGNRDVTIQDLGRIGINNPMLVMRPPNITTWDGIGRFKTFTRNMLAEKMGKRCALNMGDQWTDMHAFSETDCDLLDNMYFGEFVLYRDRDNTWNLKLAESSD